jgi:hypothetical protein
MAQVTNYIKLPKDGQKQNKGARDDPNLWRVVAMDNPSSKFKVIDNSNPPINVAHMFDSQATAQQFIDHFKWIKGNPCPDGQEHDPETGICQPKIERPSIPKFVKPGRESIGVLFDGTVQANQPITLPDSSTFMPRENVNTGSEYGQTWRNYRSGGGDGSFELNIKTGTNAKSYLVQGYYALPPGLEDHKKGEIGEVTNIINDGHFEGDGKHQYKLETFYRRGGTLTGEAVLGTEDDHEQDVDVKELPGANQLPDSKEALRAYSPGNAQAFMYVVKKVKDREAQRIKYWIKDSRSGQWVKVFDHVDSKGANNNIRDYLNHSNNADAVRIDGCTIRWEKEDAERASKGIEETARSDYDSFEERQKTYLETIADSDIRTLLGDDEDDPANWMNDKPFSER